MVILVDSRWGTVGQNLALVVDVSGRRAPCCFGSALGPFGLAAAHPVPREPRWGLGGRDSRPCCVQIALGGVDAGAGKERGIPA